MWRQGKTGFAKALGLVIMVVVCAAPTLAQTLYTWTDLSMPTDQNWNDPNNWNPNNMGFPNNGANVNVPNVAPLFSPILNVPVTLNNLTINSGAVVAMGPPDGVSMTLSGSMLSGDVQMNNKGGATTGLIIGNTLTYYTGLNGLSMFDNSSITGGGTLINQGTIAYGGGVGLSPNGLIGGGLTVQNFGTITSGVGAPNLEVTPNSKWLNDGEIGVGITSTQGGVLQIAGGTITQQPAGLILANGGTVYLQAMVTGAVTGAATIDGGILATANGGSIVGCAAYLENLTNNGAFVSGNEPGCPPNFSLGTDLVGTITNNGSITVMNGSLGIINSVTLAGSGSVLLSDASISGIGGSTFTNQQTISGVGGIGVALDNEGTISAGGGGTGTRTLTIGDIFKTNGGTLTAAADYTLEISSGVLDNYGGFIFPAEGGTVLLDKNVQVNGGTVAGVTTNGAALNGTTNAMFLPGIISVEAGSQATLGGTINGSNDANITVGTNSGSGAILAAGANLALNAVTVSLPSNINPNQIILNGFTATVGGGIDGAGDVSDGTLKMTSGSSINCNDNSEPLTFATNTTVGFYPGSTFSNSTGCTLQFLGDVPNINQNTGTIQDINGTFGGPVVFPQGTNIVTVEQSTINWMPNASCVAGSVGGPTACNFTTIRAGSTINDYGMFIAPSSFTVGAGGTVNVQSGGSLGVTGSGANINVNGGAFTNNYLVTVPGVGGFYLNTGTAEGTNATYEASVYVGTSSKDLASRKNTAHHLVNTHPGKPSAETANFVIGTGPNPPQAGLVTITQSYTQAANGVLYVLIGGINAGTQYSQLNVTGSATLSGTLNVALIKGFVPQVGQVFTVMNGSEGITDTFTTVNGLAINSDEHFAIAYNSDSITLTVESGPLGPR